MAIAVYEHVNSFFSYLKVGHVIFLMLLCIFIIERHVQYESFMNLLNKVVLPNMQHASRMKHSQILKQTVKPELKSEHGGFLIFQSMSLNCNLWP